MTGQAPAAWATEAALQRLRDMWPDLTISTAELGRRLGASKNAIVGKAHRMHLPSRPSPVLPRAVNRHPGRPPAAARSVPSLPPLASATEIARDDPPPLAPLRLRPAPVPVLSAGLCCWPIGDPGTRSFRFCDAETERVYCDEHHKLAHQPIGVRVREPEPV